MQTPPSDDPHTAPVSLAAANESIFHADYKANSFNFQYAIENFSPPAPPPPPFLDRDAAKKVLRKYDKQQNIAVSLLDAETGHTLLDFNGDKVFIAASTYKLFTAYDIYQLIENKKLKRNDYVGGSTMSDCITLMIVYSDNYCVESWLGVSGFDNATRIAESVGTSNTKFALYNMRTSANDVALFLLQLYKGELLSKKNTAEFLGHMKDQIWRDGIPAALEPEAVVFDKIGRLDGITHDAAIIQSEKGDLVLVIMTEFNDYSYIKKIAADIFKLL